MDHFILSPPLPILSIHFKIDENTLTGLLRLVAMGDLRSRRFTPFSYFPFSDFPFSALASCEGSTRTVLFFSQKSVAFDVLSHTLTYSENGKWLSDSTLDGKWLFFLSFDRVSDSTVSFLCVAT